MSKKKIMVVDDNAIFLDEIDEVLILSGYKTIIISDSRKAVEAAQEHKPDLILLDFMMEGLHGFQVADRLRVSPLTGSIPLIAMSAFLSEDYKDMLKSMYGFQAYLQKPFKTEKLILEIERALKGTNNGLHSSDLS